ARHYGSQEKESISLMADSPILVASDLSARADRPVERAIRLGRQLGRPVCLVHVRDEDGKEADPDELERHVRATLPEDAEDIDIHVPTGPVAEEIAHVGDELDA